MALKFSNLAAIAAANAIADAFDAGASSGSIEIYSGTQPANPETAITSQVKLVDFVLPEPGFGDAAAVSGGAAAVANAITAVNAGAAGTATWFRALDGDGNALFDGTVSDTTGSGDMKVSSTTIVSGIEVSIVSFSFTQPKGW